MYQCPPKDSDLYALRLLLLHAAGAREYEELRTVDGVEKGSFREAAKVRGLIQNVDEIDQILNEPVAQPGSTNKIRHMKMSSYFPPKHKIVDQGLDLHTVEPVD